jgi:hypothetical protein
MGRGMISGWTGVSRDHTHHRTHISCFSLFPRGTWQTLCRYTKYKPNDQLTQIPAQSRGTSPLLPRP